MPEEIQEKPEETKPEEEEAEEIKEKPEEAAEEAKPEQEKAGEESAEDVLSLGGNIELSGFREVDRGAMVVVKKMVGNYAKTFSEKCKGFEKLSVYVKPVHEVEKTKKFELHATLFDSGKRHTAKKTDKNLFFALDSVMKKLEKMIA